MLTQSAAYALQSEFLPKTTKMPRVVSDEQNPRQVRQCREPAGFPHQPAAPRELLSFEAGAKAAAAASASVSVPFPPLPSAKPIPLPPTHIPRTKSELQLAEDMHAAEWRDRCMFQRLVTGIRERQAALERSQRMAQLAEAAQQQQHKRRGSSKLRQSLAGAVIGSAPMAPQLPAPPVKLLPPVEKVLTVSPYQSLTSSPAAAGAGPFPAPQQQQQAAAVSRQHLQNVLHRASSMADAALTGGFADEDWSMGGYEQAPPQQPEPAAARAPTPHQSYFLGPPPPIVQVEEDEGSALDGLEEEDDMADGEIFSLDM